MKDQDKNKEELVKELEGMRQAIAELQGSLVRLKRQEEAAEEAVARCKAMIEAFDGLIYVCSSSYEVEFMNDRFIQRTGYDPMGEKCYQAIHDRDEICPWCVNDRVQLGETVRWEVQSPKDNRWYYVVNTPIRRRDGTVSKMAVIQDITDRKNAEEELRGSEEKYRSILETIADGYHEVDLAGNFTLANDSLCELSGYRRQELLGMNYRRLMDQQTAEKIYQLYNKVYMTGIANPGFEFGILRKDGSKRKVSASVSLIRNEEGQATGFRGIFRDVTDKMRLEEELRQAVKMEAIGRLAGSVAHDFNNILTAIIGYSGILMQQLPERSPEHEKLLQIGRAAARAADLTRQLLAFSRKQILDTEVMNLNEVIVELEKMLKRLIGEDIELVTVLNPALGYVQADASQIEQILMNLAVNARDAMPNGGNLTIETANHFLDEDYCRVHPEVEPGQYVMFAVSDSGRGMEPETLSRCFDPFFTTKQKGGGTGLGLSTVYGIVKQHRGHITVYSEPGHGTIFKVYFPKVEEFREKRPKPPSVGLRPHGKETILVVEDEVLVRNLTREALEMLGYCALTASDPREAIAVSDEHEGPIHLLLTDVVLPQMDGSTLFGKISSKRPEMKVLYMSGYTENFIVHHSVLDRGVHFIPKPFTVEELAAKIRRILDESQCGHLHHD